MGISPLHCFHQFIDNVLRGWLIRIPHTKIDDVLPARARFPLQLIRNAEDVGR